MKQTPLLVRFALSLAVVAALCFLPPGCGFATGGAVAAASNGGGGSANAPATPAGLQVLNPKTSPAIIRIKMTDAEADIAEVEFFYSTPNSGGVERRLAGITQNPIRLSTTRDGVEHDITWDFASESGIGTAALTKGVKLIARVRDGVDQFNVFSLGNDPPTVVPEPIVGEVSGVVPITFHVADSSADISAIKIEFHVAGTAPDAWQLARPAGLGATEPTPTIALANVEATPSPGTRRQFFWDSAHDLAGLERDVSVRFKAFDPVAESTDFALAGPFRIDNNGSPIAQIGEGIVLEAGDRRRGISVPVTLFDPESDPVDVVLQWRRASDPAFIDLGTTDVNELRRRLADASFVRDKQICRAGGLFVDGSGRFVASRRVKTDDLAVERTWVLAHGIAGRSLEILRPIGAPPVRVSDGWLANPLVRPIAALPIGTGVEAVVVDDLSGSARVVVIEVETGVVVRVLANALPGMPTAACWAAGKAAVLVATQDAAGWAVHEVALLPPQQALVRATSAAFGSPIRGLVAVSDQVVLATCEDNLVRVDWRDVAQPRVVQQLKGLNEPWGVALDPHDANRVIVAERLHPTPTGLGRVMSWDLRSGLPLAVLPVAGVPERPSAIAMDESGRRLHVLCEPLAGGRQLRQYSLGSSAAGGLFQQWSVGSGGAAVATGSVSAWMVVDAPNRSLSVQGGASYRRRVVAYDPSTLTLELDADVVVGSAAIRWRLSMSDTRQMATSPGGRAQRILWDSRNAAGLGPVVLRAIPMDSEFGLATQTTASLAVLPDDFNMQTLATGSINVVADLDADGDLDATSGASVRRQLGPGVFDAAAALPASVTSSCDYDGDGRNDLMSFGSDVRVWLQSALGTFPTAPTFVHAIAADTMLDVNEDGLPDLVKFGVPTLVYYRSAGGAYGASVSVGGTLGSSTVLDFDMVDLTGDGRLDLAAVVAGASGSGGFGYFGGSVVAFAQQAGGTFNASSFVVHDLAGDSSPNVADYSDIDGDGVVDAVLSHPPYSVGAAYSNPVPAHVTVVFRGANQTAKYDRQGQGFQSAGLADLSGDGLVDIVGTTAGTGVVQLPGRRLAGWSSTSGFGRPFDLDGDGYTDIVTGGAIGTRRTPGSCSPNAHAVPGDIAVDLNADQLFDVADTREVWPTTQVLTSLQLPGTAFPVVADYLFPILGGEGPVPVRLGAADIDADGIAELFAYAVTESGAVLVILDGESAHLSFVGGGCQAYAGPTGLVEFADFDDDGKLDFVASIQCPDLGVAPPGGPVRGFGLHLGGAPSAVSSINLWGSVPYPPGGPGVDSMAFGNVDADEQKELVVGCTNGAILVFQQAASGALQEPGTLLPVTGYGVEILDLDSDGVQDLLLRSGRVCYGQGSGLTGSADLPLGVLQMLDVDGDGLCDYIAGDKVVRQLQPRLFSVHAGWASAAVSRFVDFDLDGELDAIGNNAIYYGDR